MTLVTYIAACVLFCVSFAALRIVPCSRREFSFLWMALGKLNAADLSDEEKETFVREAGRKALSGVSRLFVRLLGVVLAAAIPVWIAGKAGLADAADVANFAIRYDVMAVTTVAALGLFYAGKQIAKAGSR